MKIWIYSIIWVLTMGGSCFATLHPVEGSENYLYTDDSESEPTGCYDLEFVFARGSGAARGESEMWAAFRDNMASLAKKRNYNYRVTDLDYPAVAVDRPFTNALGALVSAGQYYAFGNSV